MATIVLLVQIFIALTIFNVWILRAGKSTNYRGGAASTLREEFAVYGLPDWFRRIIGFLKILLASLLIVGIWYPPVTNYAAFGMAILMLGAIAMHLKVNDPITKALPALSMLALSLFVAVVCY